MARRDASAQAGTKQDDDDAPRKSRHWTRGYATRMRLARVGTAGGQTRALHGLLAQADSCCASENGSCLIWGGVPDEMDTEGGLSHGHVEDDRRVQHS